MKTRINRILCAGLIALVLLMAACTAPPATVNPSNIPTTAQPTQIQAAETSLPAEPQQIPVVVDSDMGANGVMAILYILQRSEYSVKAITIAASGESHCKAGAEHALGLIAITGSGEIPVACGGATPLVGDHQFPSSVRSQADSSLRINWPEVVSNPTPLTAADLILAAIHGSSQPVVLVADGPLTNVAEAILTDPQVVNNIRMIYIMGGAIDVPGNLFDVPDAAVNKTAEFNIYVDPHAANVVLNSGAPITLVPLDATNQVPLDAVFYDTLSRHQNTPAAEAVYEMLDYTESYLQMGYCFWDPLTYAIASDESLATFVTRKITVIEEDGPEIGRTKVSQNGTEVRVALTVEADRFLDTYLSTLNGGQQIVVNWVKARATPTPPANTLNVIIQGGKCWLQEPKQVPPGMVGVNLINNDPTKDAGLAIVTADAGKTVSDMIASPGTDPPSWVQVLYFIEAHLGYQTLQIIEVKDTPIYLVCFESPPDAKIGVLGPFGVIE